MLGLSLQAPHLLYCKCNKAKGENKREWQNKEMETEGKLRLLNTAINLLVRVNQYSPPSLAA